MTEEAQKNFGIRLTVCFEDKAQRKIPLTLEHPSEARLKELNSKGYGIFETPNSFFATDEQRKELAKNKGRKSVTQRNKEFLVQLNEVFADLDVCKDKDGLQVEEREQRKERLKAALDAYCPPSAWIITKNGLQPRWWISEEGIDEATQQKYINVINGIIAWSKTNGANGDPVKDVTRLLRKAGYYHLKSDPYLVTEKKGSDKVYRLDELKNYFWHEPKSKLHTTTPTNTGISQDDSAVAQVDALDIQQVVVDVWADKGQTASFDRDGHLIVDGILTATFKGKQGHGNYIATSSSDYPAKGNAVTYVATTLGITTKEAFKWLCKKYVIDKQGSGENNFKSAFRKADKKEAIHALALHLIDTHHIKTTQGKNREMYVYSGGVYVLGEDVVRKKIRELLEELCTAHYSREIIETIKDLTATERKIFEVDVNLINCENGVYCLHTQELDEHHPNHTFLTKIPVKYKAGADCPAIKKYLSDVLDEDQILIVQEWFGYALYRSYFIKKALICVGEGDTGKSTLISLFFAFIGATNVSGVSLQRMSTDKFVAASLYQKYINLFDDLSFSDINDNGAFKIATGGGIITGEKKFGDQFQFKNFAKLTFACNKIPDLKDTNDEAYFKRWIMLPFNRIVEEEDQDKQLILKLTGPEELSGLLNFALEGLFRLLENESFSYDKEPNDIKTDMLRSASPIARFAYDSLEECTGEWISKTDMYQAFQEYTHKNNLPAATVKTFSSRLSLRTSYLLDYKPKDSRTGKQVNAWGNVKFKAGVVVPSQNIPEDPGAIGHLTF